MSTEEHNNNARVEKESIHDALDNQSFIFVVSLLTLTVITVYALLTLLVMSRSAPVEMPVVVSSFLDTALVKGKLDNAVDIYVVSADSEARILPDTPGTDLINFELIFHGYNSDVAGYEVRSIYDGYVEFYLLDSAGDKIFPAVGFAYELSSDESQISEYNVCRLQPFSQRDAEYSRYWS